MKAALSRVFKKNLLIVLALIAAFAIFKHVTARSTGLHQDQLGYLDGWLEECAGMDDDQIEDFIDALGVEIGEDKNLKKETADDSDALFSTFMNRKEWQKLISFAQNKEGVLPVALPPNYLELLDFYAELETPELINEQPLNNYYELQQFNFVPILVLLLTAIFWGMHYESEIYKYTGTTVHGKAYSRTLRRALILFSLGLLITNEVFDLAYSGLLQYPKLWSFPMQSYSEFFNNQIDATIGILVLLPLISKALNVLILCQAVEFLARWKRNLKDTIIGAFLLLLALIFLGKSLDGGPFYSALQIGSVDWKMVPQKIQMIMPLRVSSLYVGLGAVTLTEAVMLYLSRRINEKA